jgi:hypothetical protein
MKHFEADDTEPWFTNRRNSNYKGAAQKLSAGSVLPMRQGAPGTFFTSLVDLDQA